MIQSQMIEKEEEIHCLFKTQTSYLNGSICDTKLRRNQRLLCINAQKIQNHNQNQLVLRKPFKLSKKIQNKERIS
ncbi:unnamed protein product [Paramecium sonneborni]|uniref:Uncharacterized protein n=1 Tax=Paramecium sonneborni TaxID=65129 RepID=A0A8S1RSS0_9CILI|nr:unnamed protein product [Paramecium sonneborni]